VPAYISTQRRIQEYGSRVDVFSLQTELVSTPVRLAQRACCSQPELYGMANHVVSTLNCHDLKISPTKYPPFTKTSTKRKGNRRLRTCRNQTQNEGPLSVSYFISSHILPSDAILTGMLPPLRAATSRTWWPAKSNFLSYAQLLSKWILGMPPAMWHCIVLLTKTCQQTAY